ncbi:MAG: hypothetical protein LC754_15165 [Acidobacteria bacterium]|nr:hypothetical protein [Acidobacteriota bacterium]
MNSKRHFPNKLRSSEPASRRRPRAACGETALRLLCVALLTLLLSHASATAKPRAWAKQMTRSGIPRASRQMIVVTTASWDEVNGQLRRYERKGARGRWQQVGVPVEVVVGKHGLGWGAGLHRVEPAAGPVKKEGDGKAPAGVFALSTAFGYAPRAGASRLKLPYVPLDANIECVDDTQSVYYNRIVDKREVKRVDWHSSEKMRSVGELYRWGIVVAHNADPPQPGAGSCIFLHIWSGHGHGTAGCTAMTEPNLEGVLRWLDRSKRPVLVQLPEAEYERLRAAWQLPDAGRIADATR